MHQKSKQPKSTSTQFTVVHTSDLHLGKYPTPLQLCAFVNFQNELIKAIQEAKKPEDNSLWIVVIAGDIFDNYRGKQHLFFYEILNAFFSKLHDLHFIERVFINLGNHSLL